MSTISATLTLRLISESIVLPLQTDFQYSTDDPMAVVAMFDTGEDETVRWVFARDLLNEGLDRRTGEGDIVVWPATDANGQSVVHIRLQSPDGTALIEADSREIEGFLAQTNELVAPGKEGRLIDLDSMLVAILDDA